MKKTALLALAVMILAPSLAIGAEPLILEPLQSPVLSTGYGNSGASASSTSNVSNGVYEATYDPNASYGTTNVSNTNDNMVPQNAAAKGEPVPAKRVPRIRIRTKQRSQGNSYWNPGGKGTKSYF